MGKKEEIEKFLERRAEGSALDTLFGRHLLDFIREIPEKTLCDVISVGWQFLGCVLVSDDIDGISRFNVLFEAHATLVWLTHGPQCRRLEMFSSCRKLLENNCGEQAVRFYRYSFTLMNGSCDIQQMMEDVPCEWQDILYSYYIGASEGGNLWPTGYNLLHRPMFLENGNYSMGNLMMSSSLFFSTLHKALHKIALRCSQKSADSVRMFFERLKYTVYDFYHLAHMLQPKLSSSVG